MDCRTPEQTHRDNHHRGSAMNQRGQMWTTRVTTGWKCPFCKTQMRVRNSRGSHPLLKNYLLQCTNVDCTAVFRAHMEITGLSKPTAARDPGLVQQLEAATQHYQHAYATALKNQEPDPTHTGEKP